MKAESGDSDTEYINNVVVKSEKESAAEVSNKYKCEECGKTFRLASGLRVHSQKHGKKLKCEVCEKEFKCEFLSATFFFLSITRYFSG